ncbi:Na(+)/H(+) antiporter subunit B [Dethiothermospora halolimnae]|uniref:Na(+)/H(+) antiporter subunit B n=1 Tax=Dethiothermospora halolimnae TaxID=3114390 RepID=UPI003CCB92A9
MKISHLLQILLIFLCIYMIKIKDNLRVVISFSVFSLITAGVYYFLKAPDLALAEAAIGSAIIPLVYIIAISKQREFLVVSHISEEDDFFLNNDNLKGEGYKLLEEFTKHYNLKLVISHQKYDQLQGIFRTRNIDLVIEKCKKSDKYMLKGKKTSILMNKLEKLAEDQKKIKVIKIGEGEMDD